MLGSQIEGSLLRLENWVRRNGWAGYDPYDLDHWLLSLPERKREFRVFGKRPSQLVMALGNRYPHLARRIFVLPKVYPKAMGLFAAAYTGMYEQFGKSQYLDLAKEAAEWLMDNVWPGSQGYSWGLPISWRGRMVYPKTAVYSIVGVICGEGFWRLFECTGEPKYLECCRKVCEGFLNDLRIDQIRPGVICFSYSSVDHYHVHNCNLWVSAFLVKVGQVLGNQEYIDRGLEAANYALDEQEKDGSLSYWGKDQAVGFHCDSIHSGFEIRSFHSLWRLTDGREFRDATKRYYDYYKVCFFGRDGAVWRAPRDPSVVDVHGCAEALICNSQLAGDFPEAWDFLRRSAEWTLANMQSPRGYFIYRIETRDSVRRRIDVPHIRWGQAWMMLALVSSIGGLRNGGNRQTASLA